ncbi:MAG: hypothetical protein COB07_03510 [Sulfurovum sp.]|nr:MAG: hypothetical protein COB07_03510 [Sulfurovum sp.]
MKILLINNNPLVSRMLALCTRDEDIVLDEVKSVDGIGEEKYDLLFVDDSSYVEQVDTLLEEGKIRQKVFIAYSADDAKGFDETIKKPFLPSQIIKVIESVELTEIGDTSLEKHSIFPLSTEDESEDQIELPDIFPLPADKDEILQEEIPEEAGPELQKEDGVEEWKFTLEEEDDTEVLNSNEIEKIKALLDMDEEEDLALELLSEEDYEARKVEVITEQLMADGLEILKEEEMIDALSVKHKEKPADKRKKSKSKSQKKHKEKKKKAEKKKKKASKFSKNELGSIEDAVALALESLDPKKMKKLLKGKEIELNIKLEDHD